MGSANAQSKRDAKIEKLLAEYLPALDLQNFGYSSVASPSLLVPIAGSSANSTSAGSSTFSITNTPASEGISSLQPLSGTSAGTVKPSATPVSGGGSGPVSISGTGPGGSNQSGWKGSTSSDFQTASNWDNGFGSNYDLYVGAAWVTAGRGGSTTLNNASAYSGFRITFESISSPVTFTLQGSAITLFDFGGNVPKVENQSSATQIVNAPITFGSGSWGELNAVNGTLTMGGSVTATAVAGIRLYGSSQVLNLNGTVNATGKYIGIATAGTGNTVNINGTTTASDFSVINNGALNLNSGGTLNASVRLGVDYTGSGNVNNTQGASFNLTNVTGGQTFSGVINSAGGIVGTLAANTSGALAVNSQNTSGINTLSGHIALDSSLTITQAAGGTLDLTAARTTVSGSSTGIDTKTNILMFSGGGNFVVGPATPTGFGTIYDSTSGGQVVMNGTGSLSLNDRNTFRGGLTIKSGTVFIGANDALGGTSGTGAVFLGNTAGTAPASLLTTGAFTTQNPITVQSGNTGIVTLGGSTAAASIYTGAITLGTASSSGKSASFVAAAGGSVDFQGTISDATSASSSGAVTIGDSTHSGTVKFSNTSSNYGGITTITNGATLAVTNLGTTGNSSVGNSSRGNAGNLIIDGSTLQYIGAGETTGREFTVTSNGATIDSSGTGALTFTAANNENFSGAGNRNFTLTGSNTGLNMFTPAIANPSSGSTSVVKNGVGTWIIGGTTDSYSGTTTVNGGTLAVDNSTGTTNSRLSATTNITVNSTGTFLLYQSGASVSTNRIVDSATVTLNGGKFATGGLSEGTTASAGIGALTLQATSIIDLGSGSSVLHFADSHSATWNSGVQLDIYNWSGSLTGGGTDQILFGTSTAGLSSAQLGEVEFFSDSGLTDLGSAKILANGEIVPIPEASTWITTALALSAVIGLRLRAHSKRRLT